MKIAIFADLHWGARGDSQVFLEYFAKFYREFAFPIIERADVEAVILAGDIVDRRKYINYITASVMGRELLEPLQRRFGSNVYAIAGNHDCPYKNTNDSNALQALVRQYGFTIFDHPSVQQIGDRKFSFIPWINQENQDAAELHLKHSDADVVIGHFELRGFEMYRGMYSEHGMSTTLLDRFPMVLTGHYHHRSRKDNIQYLGAPYQITWADWNDPRGFHILDTDNLLLTHYENPNEIFHKIVYDDERDDIASLLKTADFTAYKGGYCKLIIINKKQPYLYDKFYDALAKHALEIRISDLASETISANNVVIGEVADTATIISTLADQADVGFEVDRAELKRYMMETYAQASTIASHG